MAYDFFERISRAGSTKLMQVTTSNGISLPPSASWLVIGSALAILILWLSDSTDVPFIKNLPFVPGFPIVGNLVQLGSDQPKRLAALSKKHGPVYQIRLGNKVSKSQWWMSML